MVTLNLEISSLDEVSPLDDLARVLRAFAARLEGMQRDFDLRLENFDDRGVWEDETAETKWSVVEY